MKKIKYLLLLIVFFYPFLTFAEPETDENEGNEQTVEKEEVKEEIYLNTLEGIEKISPGDVVTYELKVKSTGAVSEYNVTLTYENTVIELISVENSGNFKGNNSITKSPVELTFKHDTGITGEITVAVLKFRAVKDGNKSDCTITLDGRVKIEGETIKTMPKYTKNLSIKSTDNTLKSLKLNGTDIVNFKPTLYSYTQEVDSSMLYANIDAELNSTTATFKEGFGSRSIPLEYGENQIEIKTVADSGDEKTYVITLIKPDNRGTDNSLKNIILNSGKIKLDFDSKTLLYYIKTYKLPEIYGEPV